MTTRDWQAAAEAVIGDCIRGRRTITYAELAEAAGIAPPHRIRKLTEWLEALMERDCGLDFPPRAAVVVSRTDGLPRPGFFEKLERLGWRYSGDPQSLHAILLDELFSGTR